MRNEERSRSLASSVAADAAAHSVPSGRSSRRFAGALSSPSRSGSPLLHRRECPAVSGELTRDCDDDDHARLASGLERVPAAVQPARARVRLGSYGERLAGASALQRDAQSLAQARTATHGAIANARSPVSSRQEAARLPFGRRRAEMCSTACTAGSARVLREVWRQLSLKLHLTVSESDRAIDANREVVGICDYHQRLHL